jgi:phosphorylated CTD-interacting factor 1
MTGGFRVGGGKNDDDGGKGYDDDNDDDAAPPSSSHAARDNSGPRPFVIKINEYHYRKLRVMFDSCYRSTNAEDGASSYPPIAATSGTMNGSGEDRATIAYNFALFSTIVRYSALSGGQQINDFRGGGMQGAIHDSVFDCLSKWFGGAGEGCSASSTSPHRGGIECFASPFNSAMPDFFSAFPSPDVDGHFGSRGDFFHSSSLLSGTDSTTPPSRRWFELNPPFSPGVMTKMAQRVCKLMEDHDGKGSEVTCIVVIPTVRATTIGRSGRTSKSKDKKRIRSADGDVEGEESSNAKLMSVVNTAAKQSFDMLVNSPYCKSHIILPAREHGFIEGGQHLRPTKFKESQCSTSVIILGSTKSLMAADDAKIFKSELRKAFASRHGMEIEQRKRRVERKLT